MDVGIDSQSTWWPINIPESSGYRLDGTTEVFRASPNELYSFQIEVNTPVDKYEYNIRRRDSGWNLDASRSWLHLQTDPHHELQSHCPAQRSICGLSTRNPSQK